MMANLDINLYIIAQIGRALYGVRLVSNNATVGQVNGRCY